MTETNEPIIMKCEPGVIAMTPYGMARIANDLFTMAHGYTGGGPVPLARFYLYCASIEIGMKGAILAQSCDNESKKHIRKLGHDLCKVQADFESHYPALWDGADVKAIDAINPFFKGKDLEYFTIDILEQAMRGFEALPNIKDIAVASEKVNAFLNYKEFFNTP